jgi:LacI family transcriptional regulator
MTSFVGLGGLANGRNIKREGKRMSSQRSNNQSNRVIALTVGANVTLREEAMARGWRLVNLHYSEGELPQGIVPSGALVSELPDSLLVAKLRRLGCPIVRLGHLPHSDDASLPAVLPDVAMQGQRAAEHFFQRGFSDVGFFGHDPWSNAQALFEGFRERAETLGMACHLYRFRGIRYRRNKKRKQREFTAWLNGLPLPLGLLAPGDDLAARYCTWIQQADLVIPEDIAVFSRGSLPDICESTIPTISAFEPDEESCTRAACDLLARLMQGEPAPTAPIMIHPGAVIERESTNVLATPDRVVANALRYMWDHYEKDLSVDDIASVVGLSGRQLERRFQQALQRTVNQELRRKRLEEAKILLHRTDLAVADVGARVGFHSTTFFHRSFRSAFGQTPARYRRGV